MPRPGTVAGRGADHEKLTTRIALSRFDRLWTGRRNLAGRPRVHERRHPSGPSDCRAGARAENQLQVLWPQQTLANVEPESAPRSRHMDFLDLGQPEVP